MPPPPRFDFRAILRALQAHGVDFIVVGGVCATLHGSPVNTQDLDAVHSRDPENVSRLAGALEELNAVYRLHHSRQLPPPLSAMRTTGHQLLTTDCGNFDLRGAIGDSLSHEELLPHTEMMDLGEGLTVRVLDLPTLIQVKEQAGRPKDLFNVLHLKEVLRETRPRRARPARTPPPTP